MKSTGEAMAIGRTFEESLLLKALRSSEYEPDVDWAELSDAELEEQYLERPSPDRPYAMFEAFERGYTVEEVQELTGIFEWYTERYKRIADSTLAAQEGDFTEAAIAGHTNATIASAAGAEVDTVETDVPGRTYKQVDTCAGEFEAETPYYYSARKSEFESGPLLGDAAAGELRGRPRHRERDRRRRRPDPHRTRRRVRLLFGPRGPRCANSASTPTSSTTTPRPSRPTTTPPTACSSNRSPPRRSPTSQRRPVPMA